MMVMVADNERTQDGPERPSVGRSRSSQHDGSSAAESPATTRTSGSEERSCRACGQLITGRRRNGYCSDKCRMRVRRQEKQERLAKLVANAESALDAIRKEVRGG